MPARFVPRVNQPPLAPARGVLNPVRRTRHVPRPPVQEDAVILEAAAPEVQPPPPQVNFPDLQPPVGASGRPTEKCARLVCPQCVHFYAPNFIQDELKDKVRSLLKLNVGFVDSCDMPSHPIAKIARGAALQSFSRLSNRHSYELSACTPRKGIWANRQMKALKDYFVGESHFRECDCAGECEQRERNVHNSCKCEVGVCRHMGAHEYITALDCLYYYNDDQWENLTNSMSDKQVLMFAVHSFPENYVDNKYLGEYCVTVNDNQVRMEGNSDGNCLNQGDVYCHPNFRLPDDGIICRTATRVMIAYVDYTIGGNYYVGRMKSVALSDYDGPTHAAVHDKYQKLSELVTCLFTNFLAKNMTKDLTTERLLNWFGRLKQNDSFCDSIDPVIWTKLSLEVPALAHERYLRLRKYASATGVRGAVDKIFLNSYYSLVDFTRRWVNSHRTDIVKTVSITTVCAMLFALYKLRKINFDYVFKVPAQLLGRIVTPVLALPFMNGPVVALYRSKMPFALPMTYFSNSLHDFLYSVVFAPVIEESLKKVHPVVAPLIGLCEVAVGTMLGRLKYEEIPVRLAVHYILGKLPLPLSILIHSSLNFLVFNRQDFRVGSWQNVIQSHAYNAPSIAATLLNGETISE